MSQNHLHWGSFDSEKKLCALYGRELKSAKNKINIQWRTLCGVF